jgi:hypothetical protein
LANHQKQPTNPLAFAIAGFDMGAPSE